MTDGTPPFSETEEREIYLIGHVELDLYFNGRTYETVFRRQPKHYKIGVATNAEERLPNLASGTPYDHDLITTLESDNPSKTERLLHQYYSDYRVTGEWFGLPLNGINSLKSLDYIAAENLHRVLQEIGANRLNWRNSLYVHLHRVTENRPGKMVRQWGGA